MTQINNKKYGEKYRSSGKKLNAIAFNFNSEKRCIDDWQEATL
ncbi:MAG: hypothetical protein HC817_14135 [Saprospiraceae bacterium]|nr:hypothetical protein [Saprospiraceae bacterium]